MMASVAAESAGPGAPDCHLADDLKRWLADRLIAEADPAAILRLAAEAVGRHLGVARVAFGEVEAGAAILSVPVDWTDGLDSMVGDHSLDPASPLVAAYTAGATIVCPDIATLDLPPAELQQLRATSCTALVAVPLPHEGALAALLLVMDVDARVWRDDEVELIEHVAQRTHGALRHARAIALLRQSEEQFKALADHMPGITWLSGTDGRVYWVNRRGREVYGEADGVPDHAAIVHPDDLGRAMGLWKHALRSGEAVETTVRVRGADGRYRLFLSKAQPIRDAGGRITRWCGLQLDLSEQQERASADALVREVSDAIRDERDVQRIIDIVTDKLRRHLGVLRINYSVFDAADPMAYRVLSEALAPGAAPLPRDGRFGPEMATMVAAFARGETVAIADARVPSEILSDGARSAFLNAGIASGLNAPLIKDGRLVASLVAHHDAPRAWTEDEITLLGELADRTWAAVRRARAEAALHERERGQSFLIGWSDAIRGEHDAATIIASTLQALGEHLGVGRASWSEVEGDGSILAIRSEWLNGSTAVIDRAIAIDDISPAVKDRWLAGEPSRFDDILADPRVSEPEQRRLIAGNMRAFLSVPLTGAGALCGVLSVQQGTARRWHPAETELVRDVATRLWAAVQQARAEAALKERERAQAFLIAWSDRLRAEADPAAILAVTLELLGRHLRLSRAAYATIDIAGGAYTIVSEWRGGDVSATLGLSYPASNLSAEVRDTYVAGEPLVSEDVGADERFSSVARAKFADNHVVGRIGVPLSRDGVVQAILSADCHVPRRWTRDEVQLVRDVSDRVWTLLERARAEAALQERERIQRALIGWSDALRRITAPDAIMRATLEGLGRELGATRTTYAEADHEAEVFTTRWDWCNDCDSIAGTRVELAGLDEQARAEWLGGQTVRYDDVTTDARVQPGSHAAYARRHIAAFVSIPLVRRGRVSAIISVQSATPRVWQDAEIELIREIGERTWGALERARAEEALQDRERAQTFLIDWSDRVRVLSEPEAILETTLERLGEHFALSRSSYAERGPDGPNYTVLAEWRTGGPAAVGSSFDPAFVGAEFATMLAAGTAAVSDDVTVDERVPPAARDFYLSRGARARITVPLTRDGVVRALISLSDDKPRAWTERDVALLRDVSDRVWTMLERARAERALKERDRMQAFLIEWGDRVRGRSSPRSILALTLDMLGSHLGVNRANYAEGDEGGRALVVLQEWCEGVTSVVGQRFPHAALGERVMAVHLAGDAFVSDDVAADPRFDAQSRPMYEDVGVRAALTVPLVRDGKLMAVLSVQQARARTWTAAEIALVREVADRTWAVIERARSEERLAESEALLAAFMDNAPIAMYLKDERGRYVRVNREMGLVLGSDVAGALGRTTFDFMPRHVADEVEQLDALALEGGVHASELLIGERERYAAALSVRFPVPGRDGRVARLGGFVIDLTERRRAEAALEQSRDALFQTEKLSALGSLLAGVSHELNNPLSIVVAQAVMMERQSKGTELADRAFKIRKAADRCARIVQTFLAMARQKRPERAAVDLDAVAVAALDLADYGLRSDGVKVTRVLAGNLPRIAADADQLHQIIINLLINAQQALAGETGPGREVVLTTRVGSEPGTVVLEVADNGPGIPDEARRRVFEPFYTTKPQGEGTGVGLSFSQGLAEAHGGRLVLLPTTGGATFRLTLPVDERAVLGSAEVEAPVPVAPERRRALIVDDEPEIAESLADFLAIEGYACEIAAGGEAARQRLQTESFDLIVSDLRMPDIDGPALHAWLREARPELASRLAFTTGDTLGAQAARFLATVDRPVLEKPFMPDTVRRFLDQLREDA